MHPTTSMDVSWVVEGDVGAPTVIQDVYQYRHWLESPEYKASTMLQFRECNVPGRRDVWSADAVIRENAIGFAVLHGVAALREQLRTVPSDPPGEHLFDCVHYVVSSMEMTKRTEDALIVHPTTFETFFQSSPVPQGLLDAVAGKLSTAARPLAGTEGPPARVVSASSLLRAVLRAGEAADAAAKAAATAKALVFAKSATVISREEKRPRTAAASTVYEYDPDYVPYSPGHPSMPPMPSTPKSQLLTPSRPFERSQVSQVSPGLPGPRASPPSPPSPASTADPGSPELSLP